MKVVQDAVEQGVSKLYTRRQRRVRTLAYLIGVLGLAVCVGVASTIVALVRDGSIIWPHVDFRPLREAGSGPLIDVNDSNSSRKGWQFPVVLTMPAPWVWCIPVGLVLWVGWVRLLVAPLLRRTRIEDRSRGLARVPAIRNAYGSRQLRATGKFTLPATSKWARWMLPTTAFGYTFGQAIEPKDSAPLWLNWEQRLRIIARSGWGKTLRLLVPIIRRLPGPAVISSIEPEIFMSTVLARKYRRRPTRFRVLRLLPAYRKVKAHPVFVVDCTSPATRFAAGWPEVRWNPIPGCQDIIVASRRAHALVNAVDTDGGQDSGTDTFFRNSATQVLAAWLHAAALSRRTEISDLVEWLRDSDVATPRRLLENAGQRAEPTAVMNLTKHLDPKAGRTTSGVERYLSFAVASLASGDGRRLCGSVRDPQFSMEKVIAAGGTVYLLAEPERMQTARPLLSLIAQEMFLAAEIVARTQPGKVKRLPQPFIGVLDELRYGVRVANLPYVANVLRKFGISYIYAVQSASQEDALYGQQGANELRAAAATSIYGGIDPASARDVADRAGQTAVVRATRTGEIGHGSEQLQMLDTFTIGDQQRLADGESVIIGRGLAPFVAYTRATYEQRGLRRRIGQELTTVNRDLTLARAKVVDDADYQRMISVSGGPAEMKK